VHTRGRRAAGGKLQQEDAAGTERFGDGGVEPSAQGRFEARQGFVADGDTRDTAQAGLREGAGVDGDPFARVGGKDASRVIRVAPVVELGTDGVGLSGGRSHRMRG
jgi:hypothetical protein